MRTRLLLAVISAAALMAGCADDGAPTVQPPPPAASTGSGTPSGSPATTPSAPTSAPSTPTSETSAASLAGSRWSGTTTLGKTMTLYLKPDGQFDYTSDGQQRDKTPGNDGWTQAGTSLVLKPNDGYATYTGVVNGDTYSGSASNVTGTTWTFSFTRTS